MIVDYGKLAILALIVAGMFWLKALGQIEDAGFYGVVGAVVGYITGNGNLARQGKRSQPMIQPAEEPDA